MSLLEIFISVSASIVLPATLTISGAFLCHKKWFDKEINSHLFKSTTDFMLPLYNLFTLPRAYDREEIWELWPLIASPFIVMPVLFIVGLIAGFIIKVPNNLRYSIASTYSFSSLGNMGILMVRSSCSTFGALYGESQCDKAVSYLCMLWLSLYFTMTILSVTFYRRDSSYIGESLSSTLIRYFLQPFPILALIANIVGIIPGTGWFLFNKDSVGYMLTDSAVIIGNCGIMFSQIIIGCEIPLNWRQEIALDKWHLAWLAFSRHFIVSTLVLLYVGFLWHYDLLYGDKVMAYTIFIGLSMPPPFMILVVMQHYGMEVKDVLVLILWMFIISPIAIVPASLILIASIG